MARAKVRRRPKDDEINVSPVEGGTVRVNLGHRRAKPGVVARGGRRYRAVPVEEREPHKKYMKLGGQLYLLVPLKERTRPEGIPAPMGQVKVSRFESRPGESIDDIRDALWAAAGKMPADQSFTPERTSMHDLLAQVSDPD